MNQPIIEIKNVSKKYDIAHMRGGYIALRDVITNALKNPVAFITKKAKQATGLEKKEEFWALRNVSFTVSRGEVVGVIGANGAGKSTLLKVLSQITPPTEGEVILRGRVGSLLEVGTGFHPELTGRENIFLNGAILGMKRKEIAAKFDEIVAFAGVEKFLDTPVKHYSSGMYVRLAFSVAAHMEPDILVVDEVLAVGDAEFQKKCLGKMNEITKKEGRTIFFVSHNMEAVNNLCTRTVLLSHGQVLKIGPTKEIIGDYLKELNQEPTSSLRDRRDRGGDGALRIVDAYLVDKEGRKTREFSSGDYMKMVFEYECKANRTFENIVIGTNAALPNGESLFLCHSEMTAKKFSKVKNRGTFECTIEKLPIVSGTYFLNVRIAENGVALDDVKSVTSFQVQPGDFYGTGNIIKHSIIYVPHRWAHKAL